MTTTEADLNTSRLAAVRNALTGAEWTRVASMVGVIVALHLFGWVTLAVFVAPHHFSLGDKALGLGVGLTAYTLGLRHAFDADHISAIDNTTPKLMSDGSDRCRSDSSSLWAIPRWYSRSRCCSRSA